MLVKNLLCCLKEKKKTKKKTCQAKDTYTNLRAGVLKNTPFGKYSILL